MIEKIGYSKDFSNVVKTMNYSSGKPAVTMGLGSYLVSANFEYGNDQCNVLVGNYSALAHDLIFVIGLDHAMNALFVGSVGVLGKTAQEVFEKNMQDSLACPWGGDKDQIVIGNDVWIGRGATIMGGVNIGNGAVIGAGTVVAKDIPPYAIVVGNPGKVIKYRFSQETIAKLQKIKWWYWPEEQLPALTSFKEGVDAFVEKFSGTGLQFTPTETSQQLNELKQQGYVLFYYIAGSESSLDEMGRHVLEQYLKRYSTNDKVALIIEIPKGERGQSVAADIQLFIEPYGDDIPLLMTHVMQETETVPLDILSQVDYLIMTKDYQVLMYWDYGSDFGMKTLYGGSKTLFDKIPDRK